LEALLQNLEGFLDALDIALQAMDALFECTYIFCLAEDPLLSL
jgi:hypothetical protein